MTVDLRIVEDGPALAVHAARGIVEHLRDALGARGAATLCLSGGSTPRATYERIASQHRTALPWEHVTFLFGDERCVAADDADSNAAMARDAMLAALGAPRAHVLRIEGERGAADAAAHYDAQLREAFAGAAVPRFDVLLLGVGDDGHTASLFPGDAALDATGRVSPARAPSPPHERVTLTLPVLRAARRTLFLVSGAGKSAVADACLRHLGLRDGAPPPGAVPPAARVVPDGDGHVTWLLDEAAARR